MSDFRIAHSLDEIKAMAPSSAAVTLGVFDGVHRGHSAIIEELVRCKSLEGIDSIYLITFDPHPVNVTHTRESPPILSTIGERLELFRQFPLDGVFVIKFNRKTARLDYRDFIQTFLLDVMDMKLLVLGYDCHIGKNRGGTPESVQAMGRERGFDVTIVPPYQLDGQIVSSTYIRNALLGGDLDLANKLIGRPYTVMGRVKTGKGQGKLLGFPTANLALEDPTKLRPSGGVYAVRVKLGDEMLYGMMNVGTAPTIRSGKTGRQELEVHIFDFSGDIYGEAVVVYCQAYLRSERTFPSPAALAEQIEKDRLAARAILNIQ
jgi:riboflavin kinase/FMN adenylyltransferase